MADFESMVLTTKGRNLAAKGQTGAVIDFTRGAVGDGTWADGTSPEAVTALASERLSLPIQDLDVVGDGTARLRLVITNTGLEAGFMVRELGLFADDPDEGEILYAVAYAGDKYDFLPAGVDGGAKVEKVIDIFTVVGNATRVIAEISDLVIIATKGDIAAHDADASAHPDMHTPAPGLAVVGSNQVNETSNVVLEVTNPEDYDWDLYIRIRIMDAATGGTDVTSLWPIAQANGQVILTSPPVGADTTYYVFWQALERGLVRSAWSRTPLAVVVKDVPIDQPLITSPADEATVGEAPALASSAFASDVPQQHVASRWRIGTTPAMSSIVHDTGEDAAHLTVYAVPAGVLQANTVYYLQVQHKGSLGGWSPWSPAIQVSTPTSFVVDTPVLTGPSSGNEGAAYEGAVSNFDADAVYHFTVPAAWQSTWTFDQVTGTFGFTLPQVDGVDTDYTLSVYATKTAMFQSATTSKTVTCINVPVDRDGATIIYSDNSAGWPGGDFAD
jgi:hypothetical protein